MEVESSPSSLQAKQRRLGDCGGRLVWIASLSLAMTAESGSIQKQHALNNKPGHDASFSVAAPIADRPRGAAAAQPASARRRRVAARSRAAPSEKVRRALRIAKQGNSSAVTPVRRRCVIVRASAIISASIRSPSAAPRRSQRASSWRPTRRGSRFPECEDRIRSRATPG